MERTVIYEICDKVNKGGSLEEICKTLNVMTDYMESLIKSEHIKKSKLLNLYYPQSQEKEIQALERKVRGSQNMDLIQSLWQRRYRGIDVETYESCLDDEWADEPREFIEIDLNYELLEEIHEIAEKEGLPISLLIEKYLLERLERDKLTRINLRSITKGKIKYIESMVDGSPLQENAEEVLNNIKNKKFMKFKDLTYANKPLDIKIYMANYLMNNGYSLKQVEEIAKEDRSSLYDDEYCNELMEAHYEIIYDKECSTFEEVEKILKEES